VNHVPEYELAVRARRAVTPDGIRPVTVAVRDGRIAALAWLGDAVNAVRVEELPGEQVLLPGLFDTHVHVNEPGRTEWEGFATATRAAAAGGVTTLIDMPLNSIPPTTAADGLEVKRAAATPAAWVDVGFWGGAVPGNLPALAGLHESGVFGVKAFLVDSDSGDFGAAWGGIASLQLGPPAVWTQARGRGHSLAEVVRWMATAPAGLAGLPGKGVLALGRDADLVAFDDTASFTVDPAQLRHRHPGTPYAGQRLTGVVRRTWLRGRETGEAPAGRLLTREGA
jgi:dihydroorotase-like cyclic amidohydrolase